MTYIPSAEYPISDSSRQGGHTALPTSPGSACQVPKPTRGIVAPVDRVRVLPKDIWKNRYRLKKMSSIDHKSYVFYTSSTSGFIRPVLIPRRSGATPEPHNCNLQVVPGITSCKGTRHARSRSYRGARCDYKSPRKPTVAMNTCTIVSDSRAWSRLFPEPRS
jgi:hypothetical protein